MGDFSAKSELWGQNRLDSREQEVIDFYTRHDIVILNDPNRAHTYNSTIGTSWIDIILYYNINVGTIETSTFEMVSPSVTTG